MRQGAPPAVLSTALTDCPSGRTPRSVVKDSSTAALGVSRRTPYSVRRWREEPFDCYVGLMAWRYGAVVGPPLTPSLGGVSSAPCGVSLSASGRSQSVFLCPALGGVDLDSDTNVDKISYPPNFFSHFTKLFLPSPPKPAPPLRLRSKIFFQSGEHPRSWRTGARSWTASRCRS